jgi:hypothetical protein
MAVTRSLYLTTCLIESEILYGTRKQRVLQNLYGMFLCAKIYTVTIPMLGII